MNDSQDVTVVCEKCSEEYLLSGGLKEMAADVFKDVTEIGILCPFCAHWQHSYFMNDRLRKMAEVLERVKADFQAKKTDRSLQRMQAETKKYQKAHGNFNRRMRKKLDVTGSIAETAVFAQAAMPATSSWSEVMRAITRALNNGRVLNGYEIIKQIQEDYEQEIAVATLYRNISILEQMEVVVVDRVEEAKDDLKRKYFALSERGAELAQEIISGDSDE